MITAHKKNRAIPLSTKREIGLQSMSGDSTVSSLSREHNCCRNTVYKQKNKALHAVNKAFQEPNDDTVIFYIPVNKNFIFMVVIALSCICNSSYRGIIFFIKTILGYDISIGNVFNILDDASDKAKKVNDSYSFESIKDSAADEVFHRNSPILAVVDIKSRFCPLLIKDKSRDGDTWGVHLLDLEERGYSPDVNIIDSAKGLISGYTQALPMVKLRHDHFHMIMDFKKCSRFLKNKEASTSTAIIKLYEKIDKPKNSENKESLTTELSSLLEEHSIIEKTHKSFNILSQWMQFDVLQLAGLPPKDREILYDFIVSEMETIAAIHPHRLSAILTSLKSRKKELLDVANELDDKFKIISKEHNLPLEIIWEICHMARSSSMDSCKYNNKALEMEALLGDKFDIIEDAVLLILEETHRCSSIVENFNSRLSPYLDERRYISQKRLDLLQFFLNHMRFMRSAHDNLVNKSPAEAMTGKTHKPWLEILGFKPIQKLAA